VESNGLTVPVAAAKWTDHRDRPAGGSENDAQVIYSVTGGETWIMGLDRAAIDRLLELPDWASGTGLNAGGMATDDKRAYLTFQSDSKEVGFGVVEGVLDAPNGQMLWFDYTSDLVPDAVNGLDTYQAGDSTYLVASGSESGIWTRVIDLPIATGLDQELASQIGIYPNPANSYFTLELPAQAKEAGLSLFNLLGQEIRGWTIEREGQQLHVDISQMPKGGVFLVLLTLDGKTVPIKLSTHD
jgi:hypothetical protein